MKKRLLLPIAAVAIVGLMAAFATTAQAFPTYGACSGCHSGPNIAVTATLASTSGTNATYNVSAPGAGAIVGFSGATKLFTLNAASGQFTVATGKTYTIYAVAGPGTGDGLGSTTVSPAGAPADTTAPVTVSDAKATYVSSAAIRLTATDAGSGVANTYYVVDGGVQLAGTAINVTAPGAHTVQFWSVDVAGNAELRKTAAFTITVPAPVDVTAPVTVSDVKATYVSSAAIKLTATDAMSGVANTFYILDGGTQVTGTAVTVTAVGTHTIQFWSADVAGNVEARKTASFTVTAPVPVDATAPVTVSDAKATYVSSAAIKLTATDAMSGVANTFYILDGGTQVTGTAVTVTAVGTHTIQFWSADVAGNVEARKTASFTVTAPPVVDVTAPVTVSDAKATYVSSAAIRLTATDAGSGVANTYYILDGGTQVTGNTASVSTTGTHTISFWSADVAGNVEARKTASFNVTAPAPVPGGVYSYTTRVSSRYRGRLATLTNTVTGAKITAVVSRRGSVSFTSVPAGTYKLSIASKRGIRTLRSVTVPVPVIAVDDHDDSGDRYDRD